MRYLGIDWGKSRIGLAMADSETRIAIPFKAVGGIDEVLKTIDEEGIDRIVVGSPLTMKGEKGEMHGRVEKFIDELEKKTSLPIEKIDERLTSRAGASLSGDKKTKAQKDALAAMLILQSYIDGRQAADNGNEAA